ncbi:2-phospho-L-lactate guanylyltransferase [Fodinicola feengrottensis]|uniref:2-phospho-L-lactate guanylyltransferase n=1 Tax=Fodinicola feengrottensis TaxID=435914 RepID=UPI0031DEB2F2
MSSSLRWSVVVPVKRLAYAKTRLRPGLPGVSHLELVTAITADTVAAALACAAVGRVIVVTDDDEIGPVLAKLGAICVPDVPDSGLNPALTYGAAVAAELAPLDGVAALGGDRPALRPAELASALAAARIAERAVVADTPGTGTALLTASAGVPLRPAFGSGSAAAHVASGAVALGGEWPSLRRDTDTLADLGTAAELGLGPRTSMLVAAVSVVAATC